jgi:predicted Zn finger-like uncharacterized protein
MKLNCPECGKEIEVSEEILKKVGGSVTCPSCLTDFIVDGFASLPSAQNDSQQKEKAKSEPEKEETQFCPKCGKKIPRNVHYCPNCAYSFIAPDLPKTVVPPPIAYPVQQPMDPPQIVQPQPQQPLAPQFPSNMTKWNWGAFLFTPIWGLFNGIYWLLWMFVIYCIPGGILINLIISLSFGSSGNRKAWAKYNGTVEDFENKQHGWNVAGIVVFWLGILFIVIELISIYYH